MSTGSYRFTSLKNRELFGQANHLVMCSWDFFVFFAFFARKIAGHMGRPDGKVVMKDSLKPVAKKLEAGSTQTSHHGPRWIFWKNWKLLPNTTNSSWGSCVKMLSKCVESNEKFEKSVSNMKCSSHLLHTSLYSIFSDAWDEQSIYPCWCKHSWKGTSCRHVGTRKKD